MERFLREETQDQEQLISRMDAIGIEELGIPSASLALASWERQNLRYVKATEVTQEVSDFLSLFDITFDEEMLSK